ncbi:hypothetical protein [Tuwongella immobilis]|uniref:Uncharacterized protein n=1 Tax=Tuwongella immobilis TaxID=692036 RepID=A0A6C2YUW5_9BACT|nr:hypothetical protein [Tuwongella immobilis]VIP05296.1 unnamed protein product [Tuwongella immobilis]VTS07948.1 unnamed protein product [Tuwongella immobilis]
MNGSPVFSKIGTVGLVLMAVLVWLVPNSVVVADDREDAKVLVGKWKYQGFLGDDYELKADGTYTINGLGGKGTDWTVKRGKLIFTPIFGKVSEYEFSLSPDGDTLKFNGNTYKRGS